MTAPLNKIVPPDNTGCSNTNTLPSIPKKEEVSAITRIVMGALTATFELVSFGHMLDRIKIEQQASPGKYTAWQAAKYIYSTKGFLGFYTGVQWNLVTHSGKSAFRWAVMGEMDALYERIIPEHLKKKYQTLQTTLLALSVSAAEATLLVCPAELLKTKEMTYSLKNYHFVPYMRKIGWRRLFDGLDVIFFRQAVSWYTFLVAYDKSCQYAKKLSGGRKLNLIEQFGVGAVAGAINVMFTTPIHTVTTLVQKDKPLQAKYIIPAFAETHRNYGLKGFYTALGVRMVRSTWYAGITLLIMDKLNIYRKYHA